MPTLRNGRIVVTALGGPQVLKYVEDDIPEPGPREVRVKVLATGVSFADVLMRRGLYPGTPPPPFSPGYDIVGEVDAVGARVSAFLPGQGVAAMIVRGGYSRFVLVPEEFLAPVPAGLDAAEAVCMILNYVTAYQMLHRIAHTVNGEKILIQGGAGGVGTALLQLGALDGLTMYATASKAKHAMVSSFGGIPIDYRTEDFSARVRELSGNGVGAVFDAVGGWNWWRSYGVLDKRGILVCYGASTAVANGKLAGAGSFLLLGLLQTIPGGRKCVWFNVTNLRKQHPAWFQEDLATLFNLLARGKVKPVISARLPLHEAAQANERLEHSQVTGKIVLLCQE